jgi:hypothetical protein
MAHGQESEATAQISLSDSLFRAGPVTMLRGFRRAIDRYVAAAQQETNFGETFIPLFEALNWAVSLRDRLKSDGHPVQHRLGSALGYARDRVHHDWAGALHPRLSDASVEWFWKPIEQLPPPSGGRKKDANAYTELLADRSAHTTLTELLALFEESIRAAFG